MDQLTMLQLATVLTGSLISSEKIDLDNEADIDKIIKESVKIVKKTRKEIEKI